MKKHIGVALAILAIVAFWSICPAKAAIVNVTVKDTSGNPIDGAAVTVYQESYQWPVALTGPDGKSRIWLTPEPNWAKGVYFVADKDGYYLRYSGNEAYPWQAFPLAFDPITGEATMVIQMIQTPTTLGIDLYADGAPVDETKKIVLPPTGGEILVKAFVKNISTKKRTVSVQSVLYGPSLRPSGEGIDKILGVKSITLLPKQRMVVVFKTTLSAGLPSNVDYVLRVEVQNSWICHNRKEVTISKVSP